MWRQEVGSQMEIGVANSGYRKVQLRCGADYMQVDVETDQDFGGVIYTRGSYHNKQPPCFLDPRSGRSFSLKFPLSQCQTKLVSKNAYFSNFTFLLPCIVIDSFLNNQPDALIIQILFCYKTVHISGNLFAHHQEFSASGWLFKKKSLLLDLHKIHDTRTF